MNILDKLKKLAQRVSKEKTAQKDGTYQSGPQRISPVGT